jgi:Spy/CpxP family protein refolding chaperone
MELSMRKLMTAAVAAMFVLGTAGAMAQNTPNDKAAPEMAPKGPASEGAVKNEKPTDPTTAKPSSEIKKLEKDEKAGNKSTGG